MMQTDSAHHAIFRVVLVIWLAGVIWGSLINEHDMKALEGILPLLSSKILRHWSAYAGLAILSMLSSDRWRGVALALSMIALGVLIEFAQRLSAGRTPAVADAIVNAVGVCSGILFTRVCARLCRPNTRLFPPLSQ